MHAPEAGDTDFCVEALGEAIERLVFRRYLTPTSDVRRSIADFIEYAAIAYVTAERFVSDNEMNEILENAQLLTNLRQGERDIQEGNVRIVE